MGWNWKHSKHCSVDELPMPDINTHYRVRARPRHLPIRPIRVNHRSSSVRSIPVRFHRIGFVTSSPWNRGTSNLTVSSIDAFPLDWLLRTYLLNGGAQKYERHRPPGARGRIRAGQEQYFLSRRNRRGSVRKTTEKKALRQHRVT